jgi:hypothetical protein
VSLSCWHNKGTVKHLLFQGLFKRKIRDYLISRENGRFRSVYRGKSVPPAELRRYREAKAKRAKYRRSLSQLKKQIRYLKGALRGKDEF